MELKLYLHRTLVFGCRKKFSPLVPTQVNENVAGEQLVPTEEELSVIFQSESKKLVTEYLSAENRTHFKRKRQDGCMAAVILLRMRQVTHVHWD